MSSHDSYFSARIALLNARRATNVDCRLCWVRHAYWWREDARKLRRHERGRSEWLRKAVRDERRQERVVMQ